MFLNRMPRYEILSPDAISVLDAGWRRIVSEIGVQFAKPEAAELFAKAGQRVDGETVFLDPDFVLEQVAKAPREFDVQARNPANNVHIGGDQMAFGAVYGSPFVREGEVRRDAAMADFRRLAMLAQSFPELDSAGGVICEPNDTPLDSRHLDMIYALQTVTDKIYMGNVVSGLERRRHDQDDRDPVRRPDGDRGHPGYHFADQLQLTAALGRPDAGRAVRVLRGKPAGGPDSVLADGRDVTGHDPGGPGAAAGGGAVRHRAGPADQARLPGDLRLVPVQYRHAVRVAELRDTGIGHRATVHRPAGAPFRPAVPDRRRADLQPDLRRAGGLRVADDAAAHLPGRTNWVMHAAGWLEGGLVSCYEKFIVDVELLRMLRVEFTPLEIDPASLAFGAHEEVGHGGHFLGAAHTMERFRECFYRPLLSSTANYERWLKLGGKDATARASEICAKRLAEYTPPPLDDAIRAELEDYVTRRRAELGD